MKLRDLDAYFLNQVTLIGRHRMAEDSIHGAQGVKFQCPLCASGRDVKQDAEREGRRFVVGAHSILVLFSNPRGAEPAPAECGMPNGQGGYDRWRVVSGESLGDLTLAPSINCDIPWKDPQGAAHPSSCKFHGHVTNGEAA